MSPYEVAIAGLMGIGLGAACGFRVFVPMLLASLALRSGFISVSPGFAWLGTDWALAALAVATVVEAAGFMIPWVDNLLDTLATPSAVVAGTLLSASFISGMDPGLKWTMAVIVGGGSAAVVQTSTVALRAASSALTGGTANPILATLELIASAIVSVLVILVPVLAVLLAVLFFTLIYRWRKSHRNAAGTDPVVVSPAPQAAASTAPGTGV
jgi:hypothetical protein